VSISGSTLLHSFNDSLRQRKIEFANPATAGAPRVARALLYAEPVKLAIHLRRSPDRDAVQAWCPDLPGCAAAARTEDAALRLLRRRIDEHFASSTRRVPPGTRVVVLEV
jgi:hypothetical protein